jgi:hypothetical protein
VLQTVVGDRLSFYPFSFSQNGWAVSEINVGRGEIVDALVVAVVVRVEELGNYFSLCLLSTLISMNVRKLPLVCDWCERALRG